MRILILAEGDAETWDSWSGSSKSLVDHLRARGHTVTCGDADLRGLERFVTAMRHFSFDRRRWWASYHLSALGFERRSRKATAALRSAGQVDVVIQIGATFRVDPSAGVPVVLYCDSNIELARHGAASGFSDAAALGAEELVTVRERELGVYAAATRIFTMSERLRRSFIDDLGIAGDRVETIHAGANFPIDRPPPVPERRADRGAVVLFLGRAFHRKGGDLLVRAFRDVRSRVPDARLLIVGPVEVPEELKEPVPGVEFIGFVDKSTEAGRAKLLGAYTDARVFCLPTRFEPFGVAYLEAMHYELPCVGPTEWAVPEIVEDGVTGLLVPPEDASRLADALVELLTQPERATRLGNAGKRRLEEHFTWPRVVERLTASLEGIVRRPDRSAATR